MSDQKPSHRQFHQLPTCGYVDRRDKLIIMLRGEGGCVLKRRVITYHKIYSPESGCTTQEDAIWYQVKSSERQCSRESKRWPLAMAMDWYRKYARAWAYSVKIGSSQPRLGHMLVICRSMSSECLRAAVNVNEEEGSLPKLVEAIAWATIDWGLQRFKKSKRFDISTCFWHDTRLKEGFFVKIQKAWMV